MHKVLRRSTTFEFMSFEYPPMYDMPPFFTIQPVQETREKQLQHWVNLVLAYHEHTKQSTIDLDKATNANSLFVNEKIDRALTRDEVKVVLEAVVKEGYGLWQDGAHTMCVLSHKKFEDWAASLYSWSKSSGNRGILFTLYELSLGDATLGEPFHGVDCSILLQSVKLLHKQEKASFLPSDSPDETGVKFK